MGTFTIEPGDPRLADGLEVLAAEADGEGVRNVRTLIERWADRSERFDRPGADVLVAIADHRVVGVGALSRCPDVPGALRMRRFYVSPGWRRHGVARALASQLIESGFGHTDLLTCNAAASDAAPLFWASMGFEPVASKGITHTLRRP